VDQVPDQSGPVSDGTDPAPVPDQAGPVPVPDQDGPAVPPEKVPPGKSPDKEQPGSNVVVDDVDGDEDSGDLVECELISPNKKIILSNGFEIGSNKSATRACMSEHACLQLINAYASKRDCSISVGPSALAESQAQCTKIFPGSKGTCHNASAISDADVAATLELMGK
jgi:hypothetical protein